MEEVDERAWRGVYLKQGNQDEDNGRAKLWVDENRTTGWGGERFQTLTITTHNRL